MKIILFGGAFNPVHNEHVAMLKAAVSRLSADKVIVMPPPYLRTRAVR